MTANTMSSDLVLAAIDIMSSRFCWDIPIALGTAHSDVLVQDVLIGSLPSEATLADQTSALLRPTSRDRGLWQVWIAGPGPCRDYSYYPSMLRKPLLLVPRKLFSALGCLSWHMRLANGSTEVSPRSFGVLQV